MSTFSRNVNHHWKCREQRKIFQVILVLMFWNLTIFQNRSDSPHGKRNLIPSIANLVSQEIRKYQKNIKYGWAHSIVPSLPSKTKALLIVVKKHDKTHTKLFLSYPVLLDCYILFQIFCLGLQVKIYQDCKFIQALLKIVNLNLSQKGPKELVGKQISRDQNILVDLMGRMFAS